MNTIFIKIFFSTVCLFIFLHVVSFSIFEIRTNKNTFGGVFTIVFTIFSIIFSNIVFWMN